MARKRRRTMLLLQLPEDLMIEILSRVPSTDPLLLRCVCKWWKTLISDPQFVKNHLHRSITDINDLASKALEDMNAFEYQLNYAPEYVVEEAHSMLKELDNMLMVVHSLKQSLDTIKIDVQAIKDRMKCLGSFLQIYLNSVSASASSSSSSSSSSVSHIV